MLVNTDPKKIEELLGRGVKDVIKRESILKKLKSGKKLRIKHGIEPTGVDLHIGRAISYWKLKKFQDLGHQVVIIIGDFTAKIGDASDKQSIRKPLEEKEIETNMKTYKKQLGRILDIKRVELRYNSEWFDKISHKEMLKLSMNFTAQQMIQRANFKERWDQDKLIGLHELDYPLLQGYDSVVVKADVEVGGFDQIFNLLIGRDIQKIYGQSPQDIITFKMLYGLDGRKMSTSWGNVINISDSPQDQYGKIMSMKDNLIINYFELATDVSFSEIREMEKGLKAGALNPKNVKMRLAREIAIRYYGKKVATFAEKEFIKIFKEKKIPSEIPVKKIKEKSLNILDLLAKTKLVSSKSEAKRLVVQKGVKIDNHIHEDWQKQIKIKKGLIIQVGKRRFVKIV